MEVDVLNIIEVELVFSVLGCRFRIKIQRDQNDVQDPVQSVSVVTGTYSLRSRQYVHTVRSGRIAPSCVWLRQNLARYDDIKYS